MGAADVVQLLVLSLALTAIGCVFCFWLMKKAGISANGLRYYKKLLYDNYTGTLDSGKGRHQTRFCSKKGGKQSIEITQTRGTMRLEFYTEDGEVLQSWHTGDPPVLTVDLPAGRRVCYRAELSHFSGNIAFLK